MGVPEREVPSFDWERSLDLEEGGFDSVEGVEPVVEVFGSVGEGCLFPYLLF